ncbi:MAG TPA: hypothetical protein VG318_06585 [Actinomycetota bacterium]|nr:hypothetical protein [Actinomycetota bacterium]
MRLSSDGTFRKTNGCWLSMGEWVEMTGWIFFPSAHTKRDCANRGDGPYAPEQFTFSVSGDRLTVSGDGETVVYHRR